VSVLGKVQENTAKKVLVRVVKVTELKTDKNLEK
jgi:hypothetical protein